VAEPDRADAKLSPPRDIEMIQREPGPMLRGIVTDLVGYRENAPGHYQMVQPASLTIPLIISFGDPFAIGLGKQPLSNDLFRSFASGLYAGPVVIESFGRSDCIQIDFTPLGARRFFGLPMNELAGCMIDLSDLPGLDGMALRERLANERDWDCRFDLVEAFVLNRIGVSKPPSPEVSWAYSRLAATSGQARIGAVATAVGWSRKHLSQRFAGEVGLRPKSVARIMRFNHALDAARRSDGDWAGIAAEYGYADQAHLVREFREFAGASPTVLNLPTIPG
jgi:AraC-like DNA-binding protein